MAGSKRIRGGRGAHAAWLAATAFLAIGWIAMLAWRSGSDAARPPVAHRPEAARIFTDRILEAPAGLAPPRGPSRAAGLPKDSPAVADEARGLRFASSSTGPGHRAVTIVRGDTGETVPLAEARWTEELAANDPQSLAVDVAGLDPMQFCLRFGRVLRADERGVVQVPHANGPGILGCEHSGSSGWLEISAHEAPDELLIWPEEQLVVHVVSTRSSGPPAPAVGIDVAIFARYRSDPPDWARYVATSTGVDGCARFRNLNQHTSVIDEGLEFFAGIGGVFAVPVVLPIAARDSSAEPLELVLPRCSELEVQLVTAEGAPFLEPAVVRVAAADEPKNELRQIASVAERGRAVLTQVGLGVEVVIDARTATGHRSESARFLTPAVEGERGVVELALSTSAPVVLARLLGEDLVPLSDRMLRRNLSDPALKTDAEGRVRIVMKPGTRFAPMHVFGTGDRIQRLEWTGRLRFDPPLAAGETDLGDVVLRPSCLVAAGRVVDMESQRPLSNAFITASLQSGPRQIFERDRASPWRCASGPDGSFEIYGPCGFENVGLSAFLNRRAGNRVFAVGSTDCIVEVGEEALDLLGGIRGRVRLPPGAEWLRDEATAVAWRIDADGEVEVDDEWDADFEPTGAFSFRLPPGAYLVEIGLAAEPRVHVVSDVVVEAGRITRDSRLFELDLTRTRAVELEVVSGLGAAVEDLWVLVAPSGSSRYAEVGCDVEDDRARFFASAPVVDIVVGAPGHASVALAGIRSSACVELEPSIRATCRWRNALPAVPYEIRQLGATLELVAAEPGGWPGGSERAIRIGRQGLSEGQEIELPAFGRYEVTLDLELQTAEYRVWLSWLPAGTVDVPPSEQPVQVLLDFPAAGIAAELEGL